MRSARPSPVAWCLRCFFWFSGPPLSWPQQYPVQASVQIQPPYSVYLSDYANDRLAVQLQLRDLSKGELSVRLRWQIQGPGVSLVTTPTFLPESHLLGVGMPLRLDGYALAPYLRPPALSGGGLGPTWRRQAELPEGFYTFCVQVLDDITGAVISNSACASVWLMRHEPPLLNLPEAAAPAYCPRAAATHLSVDAPAPRAAQYPVHD